MHALAVELVNEALRNGQLGVDGKQQGQPCRRLRVYAFQPAGLFPGPADALTGQGGRRHGLRRGMVQVAAESPKAEVLVVAGEQNELVPQIIHHLGWHGNEALPRRLAYLEILLQTSQHQRFLHFAQLRMLEAKALHHAFRQTVTRQKTLTASSNPAPP